jgi:hypothetical protein
MSATMSADKNERELVDRALRSGLISAAQLSEAVRKQDMLEKAGVAQSLAEILERDGVVSRADLEKAGKDPLEGLQLSGFLVERKLGEGGMGAVYRAKQVSLGRPVALKVLAPRYAKESEFVARFEREARAAARLHHPHVVQPLEIGAEKGYHFYAMEFCEGGSVASRIDKEGPFSEREALEVIRAIGQALAYAAELDMIHRDIKPDNILFTRTGVPKLADLGLAKERGDTGLTQTGMILGTPNYMSPEQATGKKDLDIRTDIYALGIALFEMLTGTVPFKSDSALVVLNMHMNEPLPDPRKLRPDISDGTLALLKKMTAKSRERRHPGAKELVAECEKLIYEMGEAGGRARPARSGAAAARKRAASEEAPTIADRTGGATPKPAGGKPRAKAGGSSGPELEPISPDDPMLRPRSAAERQPSAADVTVRESRESLSGAARREAVRAETAELAPARPPTPGRAAALSGPAKIVLRREEEPAPSSDERTGIESSEAPPPPLPRRRRRIGAGTVLLVLLGAAAAGLYVGAKKRPDLRERYLHEGRHAWVELRYGKLDAKGMARYCVRCAEALERAEGGAGKPVDLDEVLLAGKPRPAPAGPAAAGGAETAGTAGDAGAPAGVLVAGGPARAAAAPAGGGFTVPPIPTGGGGAAQPSKPEGDAEARGALVALADGVRAEREKGLAAERRAPADEAKAAAATAKETVAAAPARPPETTAATPSEPSAGAAASGAAAAEAEAAAIAAAERAAATPASEPAAPAAPAAPGASPGASEATPAARAWKEPLEAGDRAIDRGEVDSAFAAWQEAVRAGAPMAEVEPRQSWARAQAALKKDPPDFAAAGPEMAAVAAREGASEYARARAGEARPLAALCLALAAFQTGDYERAASTAAQPASRAAPPPGGVMGAEAHARERLDAVAADLTLVRDGMRLLEEGRVADGQAKIAQVKARPHIDTAAAAGRDLEAMIAYGALLAALEAGDFGSAESARLRLANELGGTNFVAARRAALETLGARIRVEPRLARLAARGAEVKAQGGGRYRISWDLAAAGTKKGALVDLALHHWTLDRATWFLDDDGLGNRGVIEAGVKTPAVLRLPIGRLSALEASIGGGDTFCVLTAGGLAEPASVALVPRDDRGFLHFGPPPGDVEGPTQGRLGKRVRDLPRGAHGFAHTVPPRQPYTLRVELLDPAPPDPGTPARGAPAGTTVRVLVDGAAKVTTSGPARAAAAGDIEIEWRAVRGTRLRTIAVEGVPDWAALAKRK